MQNRTQYPLRHCVDTGHDLRQRRCVSNNRRPSHDTAVQTPVQGGCTFEDTVFSRDSTGSHSEGGGGILVSRGSPSLASIQLGDTCWICFDESRENHPIVSPCDCPRKVHRACLARWQLQQAGKYEEQFCRFCQKALPDWRPCLTPASLKREMGQAQPTMMVTFNKQVCFVPVKQGTDGLQDFTATVRERFGLENDAAINVSFGCRDPLSGGFIRLEGQGAFNAAVHCASISAAARQQEMKSKMINLGNSRE